MNSYAADLLDRLKEVIGDEIHHECIGDTFSLDSNLFTLSFVLGERFIEIRNISAHGDSGIGSSIISTIREFAEEHSMSIIASSVLDTAVGFWNRVGFAEGSLNGEFFYA